MERVIKEKRPKPLKFMKEGANTQTKDQKLSHVKELKQKINNIDIKTA